MKKVFGICLLLFSAGIACAAPLETDVSLFAELSSAYNSGFYPGAVQYAERLEKQFPDSAALGEALLIKGESLVRLNLFFEAENTLREVRKSTETDDVLLNDCSYWLARAYEGLGNSTEALNWYYDYCAHTAETVASDGGKLSSRKKYYAAALCDSGRIFYNKGEYSRAVPFLEYAVQNGEKYDASVYVDALFKLMDSYSQSGKPEKAVHLYKTISRSDFDALSQAPYTYQVFTLYAGDAYLKNGEYKKAYDLYCAVLKSGEKSLAANALKKAYNVSSAHRAEVGAEPGTVLSDTQKYLADSPELLGEFWTRLGADAYEAGDYKKALSYFDEAEKNVSVDLFLFAALYRAQIAAGSRPTVKSAAVAENMILKSRGILNEENSYILLRESNILLCRYAAIQEHWEDVKKYAAAVVPLDFDTREYLALAEYSTGNYAEASSLLKGAYTNLHALSFARQQDFKNAALIYAGIEEARGLTDEERLNYAKVLLYSGRYRESQIESARCSLNEAKYVLGLAQFNTWSWPYAEESFSSYLNSSAKKDEKSVSYAQFYLGYAQYRQGKSKKAYAALSDFVKKYPGHELFWNAQMAAANAAVQNNEPEKAALHAESAVQNASGDAETEEAVLLCAEIYTDSKKYKKALDLLAPYTKRSAEFGMKSIYKTGQIYEKQLDLSSADAAYKSLAQKFPGEKLAEEAMYRRGEMFFSAEMYDDAISRFNEYARKYPAGNFVDAAWYFTAESYALTGNSERAVLQNLALVKKFPESTYLYSSCKNLIELYREKGDYPAALEYARFLIEKYGEQAKNDGISEVSADLEKLHSGKSEEIVRKEAEFKKNGELETYAGRTTGTELVALYASTTSFSRNAAVLAEKLLPLQKKHLQEESLYAAQNAMFLGKTYRRNERNKNSAEMYLLAAEYFRMNNKDDDAAAALYGAYDSFRAAGLSGDADETSRMLKSLYPQSRQAKNIRI